MEPINITAYPNDASQIEVIKAFMKALKIKFTVSKHKPYSKDFVEKLNESKKQFKAGKSTSISLDEIWKEKD
jgi:hypothetical protein